jgi:hypothetical protein
MDANDGVDCTKMNGLSNHDLDFVEYSAASGTDVAYHLHLGVEDILANRHQLHQSILT